MLCASCKRVSLVQNDQLVHACRHGYLLMREAFNFLANYINAALV
ncbi:MAG: hypothetical protein ACK56F_24045 [bacterium]